MLEDLSDPDRLRPGLGSDIRKNIAKAQRQGVAVECTEDIDEFWRVNTATFRRQGLPMPYHLDFVRRLDEACKARGRRRIFLTRDKAGDIHAGAYIVWDNKSAYYLMGGGDPLKRKSGAHSLVIWEAIRFASGVAHVFDFEGSMIEPVERFFRAFGAKPCPYFAISKVSSPLGLAYRVAREAASLARNRWSLSKRRRAS